MLARRTCSVVRRFLTSGFESVESETRKQRQTQRADPQHLESVPDAQQDKHIEPSRDAITDDLHHDCRDQEIWDRQQHRWHTSFKAAWGADRIKQDIGRHVPTQKISGKDASSPEQADHDLVPLHRTNNSDEAMR